MNSQKIYAPSDLSSFRQGELLKDVRQISVVPGATIDSNGTIAINETNHKYAILLSQDCDLSSDFLNREKLKSEIDQKRIESLNKKLLANYLFCEIAFASSYKAQIKEESKSIWERVTKNNDFRFHFLQGVSAEENTSAQEISDLLVVFPRFFTIPADDLIARCDANLTSRLCYMESPYFEHLSNRFCHYLGRIGLPRNHVVSV